MVSVVSVIRRTPGRPRRSKRCHAAWALGFGMIVATGSTRASHAEGAGAAEVMFAEGRRAMKQGDYATACAKFAESQRLEPGGGTLMNLAACHEKQGKTAT